ncbi:MAG: hypothetical protein ACYC66_14505 [Chloroflexota bacterium]
MKDDLRARIGQALLALGAVGYRDTTNPGLRPRWRASFSFHGEMAGETRYLQVFVPVDAEAVQVNCTVEAPALDSATAGQMRGFVEEITGEYAPGGRRWGEALAALGVDPRDVDEWDAAVAAHSGVYHRMVLVRVTMPLAQLSDRSLGLATKIGYRLAQDARGVATARWEASQKAQ